MLYTKCFVGAPGDPGTVSNLWGKIRSSCLQHILPLSIFIFLVPWNWENEVNNSDIYLMFKRMFHSSGCLMEVPECNLNPSWTWGLPPVPQVWCPVIACKSRAQLKVFLLLLYLAIPASQFKGSWNRGCNSSFLLNSYWKNIEGSPQFSGRETRKKHK